MDIRPTTIEDVLRAWSLLEEHCAEIAPAEPMLPDLDTYAALESAHRLLVLGLYDEDELVGYSLAVLSRSLHHPYVAAQSTLLYVRQDKRAPTAGVRLLAATEEAARDAGADEMVWPAAEGTVLASLLPRLGYEPQETLYAKELH